MDTEILAKLKERFDFVSERPTSDHPAVNVPAGHLLAFMKAARDDFGYGFLMDLTAVDWDVQSPRFSTVYHLYSERTHSYLRVVCPCEGDINPKVPSVAALFPAADWHEREAYDMFGVTFAGHPDLRRILMWDEYPYHPLRKEFPLGGMEADLGAPDIAQETGVKAITAPMMGGPFYAGCGEPMAAIEPRAADESWTEANPKPGQAG